jgi:glycosyltransferase 2 family protein
VGVLVVMVALVIAGLRWHVFLQAGEVRTSVSQTLRAYGIGMFVNNFLPTGFGGDVARGFLIAPAAPSKTRAFTSVVVDRVSALGCLLLLAWLTVAVSPAAVPDSLLGLLAIVTSGGVLAMSALALAAYRGKRIGANTFLQRLNRVTAQAWSLCGGGGSKTLWVLGVTTVLGLVYQGTIVLATWILARAIDLDVSFAVLAVVTPLVILATLAPISIAGFGVREVGYVALLAEAGVSAPDATLLSMMNVAALAIATLPGAAAMLLRADRMRRDPAEATQGGEAETLDAARR